MACPFAAMNPWMGAWMNPFMGWPGAAQAAGAGRATGHIKSFNADKGFGFIECPATYAIYSRDVFLHKAQIGNLTVGTPVSFTCEINKQGMPQAKDVQALHGGGGGGKSGGKGKSGKSAGKGKGE